jgi:diphthamide synthase (EF-2-diphthine--ammonia ligase)
MRYGRAVVLYRRATECQEYVKIIKQVKSLAYNHVAHGAVDSGMKISRFEVCVLVVVLLDEHEPVRQSLNEAG